MAPIYWPKILAPSDTHADPMPRTIAGAPSVAGGSQHVASSAGVWRIQFVEIGISSADQIKTWRALAAQIGGRANRIVIPVREKSFLRPGGAAYTTTPFNDGTVFGDGASYVDDVDGAVAVAAAAGATAVVLSGPITTIDAGHRFSIAQRLYVVMSVDEVGEDTVAVTIWPPLREAITLAAPAKFVRPECIVRLATDDEMVLPLRASRLAAPTVQFIEDAT